MKKRQVYIVLTPTVLLFDMAGPLEVLRVAERYGASLQLHIVGPTREVSTSLPIQLAQIQPLPQTLAIDDLIIVPGVLDELEAYRTPEAAMIVDFLQQKVNPLLHDVMSICSGAFLLAKAGLLDARQCTTHHLLLNDLQTQFPKAHVCDNRVFVEDGRVLTSAGISAGVDLTLYWLSQRFGAKVALQTARHMNIYFRRSSNDPALSPWLAARNHIHPAIHRVQDHIATHPEYNYSLDELAKVAFVSSRHLSRLFKQYTQMTVHDYQRMLKHALFEQWQATGHSQEQAALAAGFSSVQAWRRSVKTRSYPIASQY